MTTKLIFLVLVVYFAGVLPPVNAQDTTTTAAPATPSPEELDTYHQLSNVPDITNFLIGVTTGLDARSSDQLNNIFTSPVAQLLLGSQATGQSFTDIQKVQVLNTLKVVKFAYEMDRRLVTKPSYAVTLTSLDGYFLRQTRRTLIFVAAVDSDTAAALNVTSEVNVSTSPLLQKLNLQYRSFLFSLGHDIYLGQLLAKLIGNTVLGRQLPAGVLGVLRTNLSGFQSIAAVTNQITEYTMIDLIIEPEVSSFALAPQVFYFHLKRR